MSRIYRTTDLIPLNLDGLVVKISPLSYEQKMDIQAELLKGDSKSAMTAAALAVRYALKDIEGIEDESGNKYQIQREGNMVTLDCWNDLQNIPESTKLTLVCLNLLNSVPKDFIDPSTGKKLEGVSVVKNEASKGKKK